MTHGQYILAFLGILIIVLNILIIGWKKNIRWILFIIDGAIIYITGMLLLTYYIEPIKLWLNS